MATRRGKDRPLQCEVDEGGLGLIREVSRVGLRLRQQQGAPMRPGQRVHARIRRGWETLGAFTGRVTYVRRAGWFGRDVGVRFETIDANSRQLVEQLEGRPLPA